MIFLFFDFTLQAFVTQKQLYFSVMVQLYFYPLSYLIISCIFYFKLFMLETQKLILNKRRKINKGGTYLYKA